MNLDGLFIARAGYTSSYTKNGQDYKKFNGEVWGIFKNTYSQYEYENIFSKTKYEYFFSPFCSAGDRSINVPIELTLFIQNNYDKFNESSTELKKIVYKISKGKSVSGSNLKDLLFYMNNEKEISKPNKKTNINVSIYTDLTKKRYKLEPGIARDNDINELITALGQDKNNPILVGERGVGTTTIVDELSYKIQNKKVPNFLKNKKIIELNWANLDAYKKYSGLIEEKVIKLISYIIKNNAILFIDEIHNIYNYEIDDIIKQAINRSNLKVIGTTTVEQYNKYFSNDNFEKLLIDEPDDESLNIIITKMFNDYSLINHITTLNNIDDIIYVLIDFTNKKNRINDTLIKNPNEKICNPYLVIQIIDTIFAHAKANNQNELTIENVIYAVNCCNKIHDNVKEEYINKLNLMNEENFQLKKKN